MRSNASKASNAGEVAGIAFHTGQQGCITTGKALQRELPIQVCWVLFNSLRVTAKNIANQISIKGQAFETSGPCVHAHLTMQTRSVTRARRSRTSEMHWPVTFAFIKDRSPKLLPCAQTQTATPATPSTRGLATAQQSCGLGIRRIVRGVGVSGSRGLGVSGSWGLGPVACLGRSRCAGLPGSGWQSRNGLHTLHQG